MTWDGPMQPQWMHPANDPHTEHRMRITWLEVRMDKLERTTEGMDSKREPPRSVSTLIREWSPVIMGAGALLAAIAGKLKWPEAIGLVRTLFGG